MWCLCACVTFFPPRFWREGRHWSVGHLTPTCRTSLTVLFAHGRIVTKPKRVELCRQYGNTLKWRNPTEFWAARLHVGIQVWKKERLLLTHQSAAVFTSCLNRKGQIYRLYHKPDSLVVILDEMTKTQSFVRPEGRSCLQSLCRPFCVPLTVPTFTILRVCVSHQTQCAVT